MDTCVRSLSFVHHISSLNPLESRVDMNEKARCRAGPQVETFEEEIICPKPRRMALSCYAPEFRKPVCHWESSSKVAESDAGYEILEIFLNKGVCGDGEVLNFGCSPTYCSPPRRASNPIVQDILFRNQRTSSPIPITKPNIMSRPSVSTSPSIRVEGFDCPMMEMRCDVRASA